MIEHEAAAALRAQKMIEGSSSMQAYLKTLTEEQQRRFGEFAHELYHSGLEDGLSRVISSETLVKETELFVQGAGQLRQIDIDKE